MALVSGRTAGPGKRFERPSWGRAQRAGARVRRATGGSSRIPDPVPSPGRGSRPLRCRRGHGRVFRRYERLGTAGRGRGLRLDHRATRRPEYLDAAGGAIVVKVGHGGRAIAAAMADQAGRLAYAHGEHVHDRAARGLRPRGRTPPSGRRPGHLSRVGRLRGDRDGPQARPGLPRRPRRARSLDGLRPLGELSRQHARRARPVRPRSRCAGRTRAGWAGSGMSRPPTRTARASRARMPLARPTTSPPSSTGPSRRPARAPSPRSSPSRSSAPRWRPSSRPTATGRRSPRSAAGTASCSSPTR